MSDLSPSADELVRCYRDEFARLLAERGEAYLLDSAALTAAHWQLAGSSGFYRSAGAAIVLPADRAPEDDAGGKA